MCTNVLFLRQPTGDFVKVSCGKCDECRQHQRNKWVVRIYNELLISSSAYMVTLTYSNDTIPLVLDVSTGEQLYTLDIRDVQAHNKRFRQLCKVKDMRYFLCGEYGSNTHRPHYHAILFNLTSSLISRYANLWDKYYGHCDIRKVDFSNIESLIKVSSYVSKYVTKSKVSSYLESYEQQLVDSKCRPSFCTASNGFGLHTDYDVLYSLWFGVETNFDNWCSKFTGFVVFCNGVGYPAPKSLVLKFFENEYQKLNQQFGLSHTLDWWQSLYGGFARQGFNNRLNKQLAQCCIDLSDIETSARKIEQIQMASAVGAIESNERVASSIFRDKM